MATSIKLIRKPALLEMTGLGWSTVRRLELRGEFPKRIKLPGYNMVAWNESEVQQWLSDLIASQRPEEQQGVSHA